MSLTSGVQEYIGLVALYTLISVPVAIWLDRYRRSIKIKYEVEGVAKMVAATLSETFQELRSCAAVWNIHAAGLTADWKRNAGATRLNDRKKIALRFDRPSCLRGSVAFPAIKTGSQEFYFLPDAVLLVKDKSVVALAYQDLLVENRSTRFIEEDSIPSDAEVVGRTWKFVNKNGGPDRRFNGNRELPICSYGEMSFRSESGVNCIIQYSRISKGDRFSKAMVILHRPTSRIETKAISQVTKAKRWPTSISIFIFLMLGVSLGAVSIDAAHDHPVKVSADQNLPQLNMSPLPQIKNIPLHTSVPRNPAASIPRQPSGVRTVVQTPPQQQSQPVNNIQQCLLIADVDERVDCFEQFRIQDR
jgi:hypothetical protein